MSNATTPPSKLREDEAARLRQAVMQLSRRLRKASAQEGFTATQSGVLATLARAGEMRATDLAAAESLNPTMLSRIIASLESDGLIVRSTALDDRRATLVKLTPAGKKLVHKLRSRRTALLLEWSAELDPEELHALLDALPALEHLAGMTDGR